ncbi:MAG: GHKL domain-containing protein [Bacteroidetes bacterium]|nr:GHKL domain-containing protein [Bacteroidota bacterium]
MQTATEYPQLDKLLLNCRWLALGMYILFYLVDSDGQHYVIWLWHAFMIFCVYTVYTREIFRPVRSLLISIVPLIIIGVAESVLKVTFKTFYNEHDNYIDTFKFFGLLWVGALWLQTRKQAKQQAEDQIKRLHEEELYREAQARKAELEVLVAERTREITEQKEELESALDHLQATQAQLVQSEKMASLGELTAGIAHEIQNPLNFVNNFAEVNSELIDELREEQLRDDPDHELIEDILRDLADNMQKMVYHGKRADSIVKGMLLHSRTSSGEKQSIDINALADEYMRLAYHGLRAKDKEFNASLEKDFQHETLLASVTPQDFGRVLLNIFNNAFYAVKERKLVEDESYRPTVWLSTQVTSDKVEIRIKDNGTGIPESVKEKIFEPFFTTKPTGLGTGLGLSLSYEIVVKGHNGTLEVESEPGAYTEFIILIPLSKN